VGVSVAVGVGGGTSVGVTGSVALGGGVRDGSAVRVPATAVSSRSSRDGVVSVVHPEAISINDKSRIFLIKSNPLELNQKW
jgi:hypothetical protein